MKFYNTNLMWSCTYLDPPRISLIVGGRKIGLLSPPGRGGRQGDRILRGLIKNWYKR